MATALGWRMGTPETGTGGWAERMGAWMRSLGKSCAGASPLRLEARIGLGGKKSLVLVSCRGRQVLLAVSGETVTPVMEIPAPRAGRKAQS